MQPPPSWVPPPFQGAPPISTGVNPQQWQDAFWQYNPAYNRQRVQQQQQLYVPSRHKPVPRPPSAEYLASRLSDNPLGLSNMIPAEDIYEQPQSTAEEFHTPWIWNPAEFANDQEPESFTSKRDLQPTFSPNIIRTPSKHRHNPVPHPPSAEYLASRLSDNPLGLSNMTPAEDIYEQPQSTPEESHSPWIWNPAELAYDQEPESFTSKRDLQPTFSPNIIRTPQHYRTDSSSINFPQPPQSPILTDRISGGPASMLSPLVIAAPTTEPTLSSLRSSLHTVLDHHSYPGVIQQPLSTIPEIPSASDSRRSSGHLPPTESHAAGNVPWRQADNEQLKVLQEAEFRKREEDIRRAREERRRNDSAGNDSARFGSSPYTSASSGTLPGMSRTPQFNNGPFIHGRSPGPSNGRVAGPAPISNIPTSSNFKPTSSDKPTSLAINRSSVSTSTEKLPAGSVRVFEHHERLWSRLNTLNSLTWDDFPWPMVKQPSNPNDMSLSLISAYIHSPFYPDKSRALKDRIKDHIKRWHPDSFEAKLLRKVVESEKEKVKLGAGNIAKYLSNLLETEREREQ